MHPDSGILYLCMLSVNTQESRSGIGIEWDSISGYHSQETREVMVIIIKDRQRGMREGILPLAVDSGNSIKTDRGVILSFRHERRTDSKRMKGSEGSVR